MDEVTTKWSAEKIRQDFDQWAEYYKDLAVKGESEPAIIDSALLSELVTMAAAAVCPFSRRIMQDVSKKV
jgi:hypothetical protein